LLSLGRLYRDSEMYALMACGIGPGKLYRPLLSFAAVLATAVGWLALNVAPAAMTEVTRIAQETRARSDLRVMEAGRFVSFGHADAVVYAEGVGADGHLRNVFVQRRTDAVAEVVVAAEAWQRDTADPDVKMLVFRQGRRYEGEPGKPEFKIVEFAEHGIPYSLPQTVPLSREPASRSLVELLGSGELADVAEIQWRVSVPVMAMVLAFLAVPLARASPRQGRFAGLGAAVLIYVCYANLLGAAKVWVERGKVPPWIGMWWVHAIFLVAAVALLALRFGAIRWPGRRRVEGTAA
jgi:lipopolysaccharide export system permease protein